jgi:hypothetical protein
VVLLVRDLALWVSRILGNVTENFLNGEDRAYGFGPAEWKRPRDADQLDMIYDNLAHALGEMCGFTALARLAVVV